MYRCLSQDGGSGLRTITNHSNGDTSIGIHKHLKYVKCSSGHALYRQNKNNGSDDTS